jgi:hypothetical protein
MVLLTAAAIATSQVTVSANGPNGTANDAAEQREARLEQTEALQGQYVAQQRAPASQQARRQQRTMAQITRRFVPSSAINVPGSPFISTPVRLTQTAAENAADAHAQVNASSAQVMGVLQAQQQRIQSGVFVSIPSSAVNLLGDPFTSTPVLLYTPAAQAALPAAVQGALML